MPRVTKVTKTRRTIPPTWQEAMSQYLLFKQAQGLRQITLDGHRTVISLLFKRHPEAYSLGDIRGAVYRFMGEPIMPATYNIRRNYLKQFFAWGVDQGIFSENPLDALKKRRDEPRVVRIDAETLARLLTLPNRAAFAGLRDYALFLLTLDTGIRPKEAFGLRIDDMNFASREVLIRAEVAKTKVSRTLPISPVTVQAIQALLSARHPQWKDGVPVFCTTDGTPLDRDTWGDRLSIYSGKLGMKIRPYDLRHAFALEFLRNGGNALALQRTMGHADLTMTKRYVNLAQSDLHQQHDLASPLNTLLPKLNRVRRVRR